QSPDTTLAVEQERSALASRLGHLCRVGAQRSLDSWGDGSQGRDATFLMFLVELALVLSEGRQPVRRRQDRSAAAWARLLEEGQHHPVHPELARLHIRPDPGPQLVAEAAVGVDVGVDLRCVGIAFIHQQRVAGEHGRELIGRRLLDVGVGILFRQVGAALVHQEAADQAAAPTKMYKWVDKNGVTQYGSSIPPEYASQSSEQLNSQGQVISTQSAQKTPAQLAAEAAAQQQAQQQAQAQAAQAASDKVLTDTYTSVADIDRDRDSKLQAMDAQINVLNGSITSAQSTLAEFQG